MRFVAMFVEAGYYFFQVVVLLENGVVTRTASMNCVLHREHFLSSFKGRRCNFGVNVAFVSNSSQC